MAAKWLRSRTSCNLHVVNRVLLTGRADWSHLVVGITVSGHSAVTIPPRAETGRADWSHLAGAEGQLKELKEFKELNSNNSIQRYSSQDSNNFESEKSLLSRCYLVAISLLSRYDLVTIALTRHRSSRPSSVPRAPSDPGLAPRAIARARAPVKR